MNKGGTHMSIRTTVTLAGIHKPCGHDRGRGLPMVLITTFISLIKKVSTKWGGGHKCPKICPHGLWMTPKWAAKKVAFPDWSQMHSFIHSNFQFYIRDWYTSAEISRETFGVSVYISPTVRVNFFVLILRN